MRGEGIRMPELNVDLTPVIRSQALVERVAERKLPATANAMQKASIIILTKWKDLASNTAGVYRKSDYLAGLQDDESIQQIDPLAINIVHTQPDIAEQVHKGVKAYDMKPYLVGTLRGEPLPSNPSRMGNAREIMKNGRVVGRYNVIPFRHKTSSMGSSLYQTAHKIAPSLTELVKGKEQTTQWGGRLSDSQIAAVSKDPRTKRAYELLVRARVARKLAKPTFEQFLARFRGMARMTKKYERATQSKYMTFRAVSVRTDGKGGSSPGSWIFPGWSGVDFPKQTIAALGAEIRTLLIEALAKDLGA